MQTRHLVGPRHVPGVGSCGQNHRLEVGQILAAACAVRQAARSPAASASKHRRIRCVARRSSCTCSVVSEVPCRRRPDPPRLGERQHVGVPLHHDDPAGVGSRLACLRQPKQQTAFGKSRALRRVHIFGPLLGIQGPGAKAEDPAAQIRNREGNPPDKKVGHPIPRTRPRPASPSCSLVKPCLIARARECPPTRRKPHPEPSQQLFVEPPLGQIRTAGCASSARHRYAA